MSTGQPLLPSVNVRAEGPLGATGGGGEQPTPAIAATAGAEEDAVVGASAGARRDTGNGDGEGDEGKGKDEGDGDGEDDTEDEDNENGDVVSPAGGAVSAAVVPPPPIGVPSRVPVPPSRSSGGRIVGGRTVALGASAGAAQSVRGQAAAGSSVRVDKGSSSSSTRQVLSGEASDRAVAAALQGDAHLDARGQSPAPAGFVPIPGPLQHRFVRALNNGKVSPGPIEDEPMEWSVLVRSPLPVCSFLCTFSSTLELGRSQRLPCGTFRSNNYFTAAYPARDPLECAAEELD